MLLAAATSEPPGSRFHQAVILVVDAEPNGIVTGICLNRPLESRVVDTSALALLFVGEPGARAFWGGPMGNDPAVLAQFSAVDGLEWFHLPIEQRRPFPLPDVGVIAVAEHTAPFEDRVLRSRLFIGLCVWGGGQLQAELARDAWLVFQATPELVFSTHPEGVWAELTQK
jgi:putative transcriptional regulator